MSTSGSDLGAANLVAPEMPPEQAVLALLNHAAQLNASDLFFHVEPDGYAVALRHLGVVRPLAYLPLDMGRRCVSHIKAVAGMDVAERRRPLDGRWIYRPTDGQTFDVRINTIPTIHGEDCSLRLLVREQVLRSIRELGFVRFQANEFTAMLNSPGGLILVAGPTGSGKTTTLYTGLHYLNDGRRKINTIEDPIEYEIPGVRQSQVNPRIDLSFPELLRSVLRQAPDVIMIGEIRDPVTAATAVHAANSGHLVLATLHAPLACGAPQSMLGWGMSPQQFASCLLGVLAQRLVRTLCPECRAGLPLTNAPDAFAEIKHLLEPGMGHMLFAAGGCQVCQKVGYSGRTGVFEVLRITREVRELIARRRPTSEIRAAAAEQGFLELRQAALLKVAQGVTTPEEVVRCVPAEHLGVDL